MRTTVDIDKVLLERAKRLTLKEGRTLSGLVNSALAAYLGARRDSAKDPAFELIVRGKPDGRFPTPTEIAATEEAEDVASLGIPKAGTRAAP
jgi:hypothetical protein